MNRHFLSATESKESTNDIFAQAQQSLPTCYTSQFDDCLNDESKNHTFPNCDLINRAYDKDFDRMQAMVRAVQFCPEPNPTGDLIKLVIVGVVGIGVGFLIRGPK